MSARFHVGWKCHLVSISCLMLVSSPSTLVAQLHSPATRDAEITDTDFFTTAETCAACHSSAPHATALRDAKRRSVAPSELWPASMMAHSSVDPLWRAVVAAEVAATPSRQAEIEAKCLRCHTPMASLQAEIDGAQPSRKQFLHSDNKLARLAADGVSCAVCHQMLAQDIGSNEHFSGRFQIGRDAKIFGPHRQPFAMPMYRHTGYVPTEGLHVRRSAFCASCHTLITDALASDGTTTGHSLLEQGPYLEWQNSLFNDEVSQPGKHAASCQSCHVPITDSDGTPINTRIARNPAGSDFPPLRPRSPFGRHVFTGGNTLVPTLLRAELVRSGVHPEEAISSIDAAIVRTRQMLRQNTARLQIASVQHVDDKVTVVVEVENLAGHKLPTAYPSRRVWIRLRAYDADSNLVFSSGDFDQRGRMIDGAGRILPNELVGGPGLSHLSTIERSDQAQIYEAVMEDSGGSMTFSLLRGARYRKDNRLLPKGWMPDHRRGPMTKPVGVSDDGDFVDGKDWVTYIIKSPLNSATLRIEVDLLYQVLGARYASELFTSDVPEMKEFQRLYESASPRPEFIDRKVYTTSKLSES